MTEALLDRYFDAGTLEVLRHYYRVLAVSDLNTHELRTLPRFESILQVISDGYGDDELAKALAPLRAGEPNQNHALFAAHLRAGGSHITANLDRYIERHANAMALPRLLHFHAAFGDPQLGATISSIEHGLPPDIADAIGERLSSARLLVVCGYSGSDYFDVDPYLADLPEESLARLHVLWLNHHDLGDLVRVEAGDSGGRRQLQFFAGAGATCWELAAPTTDALLAICDAVGVNVPWNNDGTEADPWWDGGEPEPAAKTEATFRLFAWLGIAQEVLALVGQVPESPFTHAALADALWYAGRYREALRHWRKAYPGSDLTDRYARAERSVAVAQTRGQLLLSQIKLEIANARFDHLLRNAGLSAWQLAEHRVKGQDAMAQSPELRRLVTRRSRARAQRLLAETRAQQHGVDARVRLGAAAERTNGGDTAVQRDLTSKDDSFTEEFGQAERLGAVVNLRHGRLRRVLGEPDLPTASAKAMIGAHLHQQLRLGMAGDAARTAMLPRAEELLSRRDVSFLNRRCDLARWHRLRLAVFDRLRRRGTKIAH